MIFEAAARCGIQVILDLLHFGWPDFLDPLTDDFPQRFGDFTSAVASFLKTYRNVCRFIAPVNEVSFLSWAGGEAATMNPYRTDCAPELKRNLIRSAVRASEVLLNQLPGVRLVSPEPVIHIVENEDFDHGDLPAEGYRLAQFEAWDMLSGRLAPELGGRPEYLDILGINFYDRNEWVHHGASLTRDDPRYRPFHKILEEVWNRYRAPMFVSETGTEDGLRAEWFNYICSEVETAISMGIPIHGICLYPILNHPGWDDDRHCHNGLFDYPDEHGNRNTHWPLAHAIRAQQLKFQRSNSAPHDIYQCRSDLSVSSSVGLRFPATSASYEPVRSDS